MIFLSWLGVVAISVYVWLRLVKPKDDDGGWMPGDDFPPIDWPPPEYWFEEEETKCLTR